VIARWSAPIAAAALVVLAAWEIGVLVQARASAPADDDWRAAAAHVGAAAPSDALILFAPPWIDPVGRRWLGSRITIDHAARMDAARYAQIWVVSARGATPPEVAGAAPASDQAFGALRVRAFHRAAPRVTWDLRGDARVHEVDFAPRKGILLEIRDPRAERRRAYRAAPLGEELQVYAGLAGYERRSRNRAAAVVRVLVDGGEVSRASIDNDSGWTALPVAAIVPGPHDVEFVVSSGGGAGPTDLAVCVAAESRSHR
jgi:hypothetical protein